MRSLPTGAIGYMEHGHIFKTVQVFVFITLITSSIVLFEPAPCDLLLCTFVLIGFAALGLRIPHALDTPLVLLGIFLLANIVAAMLAADFSESLRPLSIRLFMVLSFLFFASAIALSPEKMYRTIFSAYFFGALLMLTITYLAYNNIIFNHELVTDESGRRIKGTFKDPNVYGPYLVPLCIVIVARLEHGQLWGKLLKLILFGILFVAILFSFSRGALLNFVISMAVFIALRVASAKSITVLARWFAFGALLVGMGLASLMLAASIGNFEEFFLQRLQVQEYDVQEGGRFATQLAVIRNIGQYPLGVGPGATRDTYGIVPHNLYLYVTTEAGVIGGIAFVVLLAVTLFKGLNYCFEHIPLQPLYIAVFASTVGVLVESLFIDSTHWRHFYLLLALLWGPIAARGVWRTRAFAQQASSL